MDRIAFWSASETLIPAAVLQARFTASSMVIAPSILGRDCVPAVAAPVAKASPSQAPSIARTQLKEDVVVIRSAVAIAIPHMFTWSRPGISSRSVRLGPWWR